MEVRSARFLVGRTAPASRSSAANARASFATFRASLRCVFSTETVTSTGKRPFHPWGCARGDPEYTETMATLETPEKHQGLLDELLAEIADYEWPVDRELVTRAFAFAAAAHEGQQRRSGSEERRVGKECRSRWSPYH